MTNLLQWLANLLRSFFGKPPKRPADLPENVPVVGEPAVMKRARRDLGQKEIPGPEANPVIMAFWRYVDYKPPDGDETAYCSAAMNAWHAECGIPGTRQPNARSWENWGQAVKKPKPGCVAVEWRVSPDDWRGHVTLYLGPGSKPGTYLALGANQEDKETGVDITIQERPLARVLTFREPLKNSNSRTLKGAALGVISAGAGSVAILDSSAEILGIVGILKSLGTSVPSLVVGTSVLSILCFCTIIFARWSDFRDKGK